MSNARTLAPDSLILHHYDFSPFSEKIRLALGLKKLRWYSVVVPSVMPKPDLAALTGGYRHVPVMQIGADVFCDTRTIVRELDRRCPSPPLADPGVRGIATAIEAWAERDLFWPIARYVTGVNAETVDPRLHVDRAALRGKPPPSIEQVRAAARRNLAQVRAELPILEQMLSHAGAWLLANGPTKADLAVYHGLWFISAFALDCSAELEAYPMTRAWMGSVAAIGHGTREEMSAGEALAVAARGTPQALRASIDDDSIPRVGREVAIRPDEYTTAAVAGKLVQADQDDIAILRPDPALGDVVVHFPRIGYSIKEL